MVVHLIASQREMALNHSQTIFRHVELTFIVRVWSGLEVKLWFEVDYNIDSKWHNLDYCVIKYIWTQMCEARHGFQVSEFNVQLCIVVARKPGQPKWATVICGYGLWLSDGQRWADCGCKFNTRWAGDIGRRAKKQQFLTSSTINNGTQHYHSCFQQLLINYMIVHLIE